MIACRLFLQNDFSRSEHRLLLFGAFSAESFFSLGHRPIPMDELPQSLNRFGVFGSICEIVHFLRIGLLIVEFDSLIAMVSLFYVAPAISPDAVTGRIDKKSLNEGWTIPLGIGFFEQRSQTDAFQFQGSLESCQIGECRIDVHEFDNAIAVARIAFHARSGDD